MLNLLSLAFRIAEICAFTQTPDGYGTIDVPSDPEQEYMEKEYIGTKLVYPL